MTTPKDPHDDGVLVDMDAMDEAEWENDQHTPVASDTTLKMAKSAVLMVPSALQDKKQFAAEAAQDAFANVPPEDLQYSSILSATG